MFRVGILVLLISVNAFGGSAEKAPFVFHNFVKHNLLSKDQSISINDQIAELKQDHHNLKVIVLDLKSPQFSNQNTLEINDSSTPAEAYQFYRDYSLTMIQNVGFYMAPYAEMKNFPNRPLKKFPLLVLKQNIPRHALLHELGHFYIDLKMRTNPGLSPNNEILNALVDGVAEESYVDYLLLKNFEALDFDKDEICPRQKYLSQNNQVFKFHLRELRSKKEILGYTDLALLDSLGHIYSKAYSVQMKWHTECFFWKP